MTLAAAAPIPFVPRTKLRPPRLPDDLLRRPRLFEKLDRPQTLSLVIAPAGYGKTTLIGTWLTQCGAPYAWLSLEHDDDTLPYFLAGFAAALRPLVPALDGELEKLLRPPTGEPNVQQAVPILLNTLDTLEEHFVVVLDDYHHVHDPAIHQLIGGLIEHPPRALQLVLTARHDPPLPPRLRYRGNVTEIRARELCFTEQEAHAFLGQFVAEPLAAEAVADLVEQSEGWAVPLRLAAMLIYQRQDAAALDKALQISERSLLDYLDAEVIGQLSDDVQTFLVRTSILNPLSPAQCDAVLDIARGTAVSAGGSEKRGAIDSKATLRMLAGNGIFVEQIDESGWQSFLRQYKDFMQIILVPGDIVLMEAGNRVPADGRLFMAATLEIEEAALTGESLASSPRPAWAPRWATSPICSTRPSPTRRRCRNSSTA